MKPSSLLRTLSSKLSTRLSPSPVAPWPPLGTAFDRWLTSELDDLRLHPHLYTTAAWHSKSLDVAILAHKVTKKFIQSSDSCRNSVHESIINDYLQDIIDLLDACNVVRQRIEAVHTYLDSLAVALHCLEGPHQPSNAAMHRARAALDSCAAMEKRCAELHTCGSNLRKMGERLAASDRRLASDSELHEALCGSRAVALLGVSMVGIALSFRSRRGIPAVQSCKTKSWASLLSEIQKEAKEEFEKRRRAGVPALEELKITVSNAQRLRGLISCQQDQVGNRGEVRVVVGELRRRCGELEERVRPLEERVGGLYRELIDVRMSLLGMLSEV